MAIELLNTQKDSIDIDEFMEEMRGRDVHDRDKLLSCTSLFSSLCNNKRLMTSALERAVNTGVTSIDSTAGSLAVLRTDSYVVRINVWIPQPEPPVINDVFSSAAGVGLHDHYFSFITRGLMGPGYHTDIYSLDHRKLKSEVGAVAPIEYVGSTSLPAGRMMYWHKREDVHRVIPPLSPSASVNLATHRPGQSGVTHHFDSVKKVVTHMSDGDEEKIGRTAILRIASVFCGNSLSEKYVEILNGDFDEINRFTAVEAISQHLPTEDAGNILRNFVNDRSKLVADASLKFLSQ